MNQETIDRRRAVQVPRRNHGEIYWNFCLNCGMDHLEWSGKCDSCGENERIQLGTMQGHVWRNKVFPAGDFKHRSVRPYSEPMMYLVIFCTKDYSSICPCDLRELILTLKHCVHQHTILEDWPAHGHGPQWRMHDTEKPSDEGMMVFDLAEQRPMTKEAVMQLLSDSHVSYR